MKQQSISRGRFGWNEEEIEALWEEVRLCNEGNEPLRNAFDRTASRTGRKANSIRNHYYATLKAQEAPEDLCIKRATPFVPFEQDEVRNLLKNVLVAQGQGQSVRACVTRLGGGNKTLALRLQNKYRSLLKSHPELIRETVEELHQGGFPAIDPYRKQRSLPRPRVRPRDGVEAELIDRLRAADSGAALKIVQAIADALERG
ncbi:MAG: hypothetical protein LBD02_06465 [Christensenellaceae bacterium]|jgi:hypothetical protein|nr:hypothetical protein [Christensenellaceae bacterium]